MVASASLGFAFSPASKFVWSDKKDKAANELNSTGPERWETYWQDYEPISIRSQMRKHMPRCFPVIG